MKTVIFLMLALLLTASANAADQEQAQAPSVASEIQLASTVLSCALDDQGQCIAGVAEIALEHLPREAEYKGWKLSSTLLHQTASFYKD